MPASMAPVTVGMLFSQSGVTSIIEKRQRQGALLALEEINDQGGLLGAPLAFIDSEPASNPTKFRSEAKRLLGEGVSAIFGCYMSSTRKAVLPIVEAANSLLFYPTLYEGFEYSDACVYSGAAPNQNSRWLADYMTEVFGKRFIFVGSNYVYPYESNRIMRDLLSNRGAEVVDELYIPLHPTPDDINRLISRIREFGPVVVFSTIVGDGCVEFYRAYDRAGIDRTKSPIASLTFGEPDIDALGADASTGHITSAPYFSVINSQANQDFVTAYRNRFGPEPISAPTEAAYFQVKLFGETVKRTGTTDRDDILRTLPTLGFDAPQGLVRVDAKTHHTLLWPKVAIVRDNGAFEVVRQSDEPVMPAPYLVEHDDPVDMRAQQVPTVAGSD